MPTIDATLARDVPTSPRYVLESNHLGLDLSDRAVEVLNGLLGDTGDTPDELFRKALGLYRLAVDARKEGKAIGSAASGEALDTEFVL